MSNIGMPLSWEMQVLVDGEWRSVKPGGSSEPYRYPDKESAARMLRICYPDQLREARLGGEPTVRLIGVEAPANMEEYH
uniref:Uncharacterized protein n=1 Tax=viral metagenome TaxID=1070528 RepID=A0A6H1ZV49_9ZZZZ